jgi:hypothetical protein
MSVLEQTDHVWWVRLPRAGARVSSNLGATLVDGWWLALVRVLGAVATPIAFAAGLLIGWKHPGFTTLPSESLTLLVVFTVVGLASAHLGLVLLGGFVVGDFFLAHTSWTLPTAIVNRHDWWGGPAVASFVHTRLPLLISYGVVAALMVKVPMGVKAITRPLVPDRAPLVLRVAIALVAEVLLAAVTVYLWAVAAPVLLRPVYTWMGRPPIVDAIRPLQEHATTLARVAAVVVAVRLVVQTATLAWRPLAERAAQYERAMAHSLARPPIVDRWPPAVRSFGIAGVLALLLSGLYESLAQGLLVFVVLLVFQLARVGVIPLPVHWWSRLLGHVPELVRFAAGVLVMYLVAQSFLADRVRQSATFGPQLVFLLLGLLVFFVLIPPAPRARPSTGPTS